MDKPLVSIVTITYNHEPWISKAIEGVLMQKVSFPIEYLIAEDCSTDGTRKICEQYVQKYPDIIKLLPSDKNYGAIKNEHRAFVAAKGKYIATCEGDDYWTDPLKLQKQVDFMEAHSEYSVTWTRYEKFNQVENRFYADCNDDLFHGGKAFVDITVHMFLHRWMTQYLTMMFRHSSYDNTWCYKYRYFRDSHQFYHLLQNGKGAILNFVGGVYRLTGEGIYSDLDHLHRQEMQIAVFEELWKVNHNNDAKSMYLLNARYLLEQMQKVKTPRREQYKYAWRLFVASHDLRGLLSNIKKIIQQ